MCDLGKEKNVCLVELIKTIHMFKERLFQEEGKIHEKVVRSSIDVQKHETAQLHEQQSIVIGNQADLKHTGAQSSVDECHAYSTSRRILK